MKTVNEPIAKANAYGGILLTRQGRVLLREPANHFDGYVWTFAKGKPEAGDTPAQTALREVLEETGYPAEVVDVLPGVFHSGLSSNAYFIMRYTGPQSAPDWETQSTRWVDFEAAAQLIAQTTNAKGRARDLAVLDAARKWFEANLTVALPDRTDGAQLGEYTACQLQPVDSEKSVEFDLGCGSNAFFKPEEAAVSSELELQKLTSGAASFVPRIIHVLRGMRGVAKAAAVREAIVAEMIKNKEPINEALLSTGEPKYQNDIRWARMLLVNKGLLEPTEVAGRGSWKLTPSGWTASLQAATLPKPGMEKLPQVETQEALDMLDSQQVLPGLESVELQLASILRTMPDKGFERLCAEIMIKNGLHSTLVTGKSGDKGIDGMGLLAHDAAGLITIPVAWQCKRYADGKVSAGEVRNFRGALDRDTMGVIFTTSTFTADAMSAANEPGKRPIKLINLERLVELILEFKLGVREVIRQEIDPVFFEQFTHPAGVPTASAALFSG
ncbi:MAG: restriction endonuclease [Polaromonas sp.]|nr:restriction endonuclease [Polaromonas sp.]